jgi:hypothetical protein
MRGEHYVPRLARQRRTFKVANPVVEDRILCSLKNYGGKVEPWYLHLSYQTAFGYMNLWYCFVRDARFVFQYAIELPVRSLLLHPGIQPECAAVSEDQESDRKQSAFEPQYKKAKHWPTRLTYPFSNSTQHYSSSDGEKSH